MIEVEIKEFKPEDVQILERDMPFGDSKKYRAFVEKQQSGATILVAWLGDKPVGHAMIDWHGDVDPKVSSKVKCPNSKSLFIHPDFRRQGIAKKLIGKMEEMLVKRGQILAGLGVSVGNPNAIKLYESLGYKVIKTEPLENHYDYTDFQGKNMVFDEVAQYMTKQLA